MKSEKQGQAGLSELNWPYIVWFVLLHSFGTVGLVYSAHRFDWRTTVMTGVLFYMGMFSITAGYHRCFTHGAYLAGTALELGFLFFGAGAWQGSVLMWAFDHRMHHAYTDQAKDPYNFTKGFWHAHFLWMFRPRPIVFELKSRSISDLRAKRLVMLQHRFYFPLAIFSGFALPTLLAGIWGDWLGGFLVGGFVRIMILTQCTMCINSVAHWIGKRPYLPDQSPVENFFLGVFTGGEGWHNFHHAFSTDYRCGYGWWKPDTGKWLIWLLCKLRLAKSLVITTDEVIRAQLEQAKIEKAKLEATP